MTNCVFMHYGSIQGQFLNSIHKFVWYREEYYHPQWGSKEYRNKHGILNDPKEQEEYNKAMFKAWLGPNYGKAEYLVFILTDDQQTAFQKDLDTVFQKVAKFTQVHASEKFCNCNYFRGNNLQLLIYKVEYV